MNSALGGGLPEGLAINKPLPIRNAMTVDVEDYFHVSAFENHIPSHSWDHFDQRVAANVDRILELFDTKSVKATFFTLGWVATRQPGMIRRIVEGGHELASHGWEHQRANTQDRATFKEDVHRTRQCLQELGGVPVRGYRAASYSIGADNLWAHDELAEVGYKYSSSIVPVKHDHYGMPEAPRFAFSVADDRLLEIPVSTVTLGGRNINCGGGGWFRLFPYPFTRWALRKLNRSEGRAGVFYFHPWEIDHHQPRVDNLDYKTRFRHYVNLHKTHFRLDKLLSDFSWARMDDVFKLEINKISG